MTEVASPCTSVCRMDPDRGWCVGCLRSIDEIVAWGGLDDPAKRRILARLPQRLASLPGAPALPPGPSQTPFGSDPA